MVQWLGSSVGRAGDFKSLGRGFDPRTSLQFTPPQRQEKCHEVMRPRSSDLFGLLSNTSLTQLENTMKRNIELRIKIKSLAAESKIIRAEELKLKKLGQGNSWQRESIYRHRIGTVRYHSRMALLTYQYLRGIPYAACEKPRAENALSKSDIKEITAQAKRFGDTSMAKLTPKDIEKWIEGQVDLSEAA